MKTINYAKVYFFGAMVMLFLVITAPSRLYAQGVGFGLKGGVNFANVDAENINTESITSFHAGVFVNLNLSDKFGVTPEILWTGYGAKIDNADFKTNYVSIPVMLRYKPVSMLFLEAGPQFNFLMDAEYDGADYKDQLKSNEVGLGLGAGVHLPLGFTGGLRYVLGFTNINDVSDDSIKNRTFQVWVGWVFGSK